MEEAKKNLANCTPTEFFVQTNKIRKSVEKWLTATDIMKIRKRLPNLEGLDKEQRKEALEKQVKENMSAIFDAVLEEHPQETVEIMALVCFVNPEDANKYPMSYYIASVTEVIEDEGCRDFFKLLVRLANKNTSIVPMA